jgi:hypothetical protein
MCQTPATKDDRQHESNEPKMEDFRRSQRSVNEVFQAQDVQDDVDNTPLGSDVEGDVSMQSSVTAVSCTITRASTPFTGSTPPNRSPDDGATPE